MGRYDVAGKENMFVFGVDAKDIGRLREERKNFKVEDPRWEKVLGFLTGDSFEKGLFQVCMRSALGLHGRLSGLPMVRCMPVTR